MYLYLVKVQVDAITLLNHLCFLVSYNIFLRKLRNITTSSAIFIKNKAFNNKLVGMWNNFEYRKNIASKRIGDIIKFRSVIIAL